MSARKYRSACSARSPSERPAGRPPLRGPPRSRRRGRFEAAGPAGFACETRYPPRRTARVAIGQVVERRDPDRVRHRASLRRVKRSSACCPNSSTLQRYVPGHQAPSPPCIVPVLPRYIIRKTLRPRVGARGWAFYRTFTVGRHETGQLEVLKLPRMTAGRASAVVAHVGLRLAPRMCPRDRSRRACPVRSGPTPRRRGARAVPGTPGSCSA